MNGLIDIRLVLTQIVGFLLLLWALRKWAWAPALTMLETRRQAITGEFAEAERRKAEADGLKAKYEQDLRAIEAQGRQKLQEYIAEGQKVAAEIRQQANAEARQRIERAEEEIVRERVKQKELVKQQIVALSLQAAEKVLRQKLDEPAQRKLASEFIDEVGAMGA